MKKTLIGIAIAAIGFTSCQKEEQVVPTQEPQWSLSQLKFTYNGETYIYKDLEPIETLDIIRFDTTTYKQINIGKGVKYQTQDNNLIILIAYFYQGEQVGRVTGALFNHSFISTACSNTNAMVNVCNSTQGLQIEYVLNYK